MTTDKHKFSCYLTDDGARDLETLFDALRAATPLALRGTISRSTIAERAVSLALQDWRDKGRDAAIFKTLVALPSPKGSEHDNSV